MHSLIGAVLVASLLGSGHCAGMCGAFAALACHGGGAARTDPVQLSLRGRPVGNGRASACGSAALRTTAAYNLGRLATYAALGAGAGLAGAAFDLGGAAFGIQRAALVAAGAFMVLFAIIVLVRSLGGRVPHAPIPAALRRAAAAGHRAAAALPPAGRAAAIGALTPLLPCGWLYAFVVTAAGTASPWRGAATMAAFWLGTVPILAAIGLGSGALGAPLRRALPAATALLLAVVGIWTLVGRADVPAFRAPAPADDEVAAIERVRSLDAHEMPCCAHPAPPPGDAR